MSEDTKVVKIDNLRFNLIMKVMKECVSELPGNWLDDSYSGLQKIDLCFCSLPGNPNQNKQFDNKKKMMKEKEN